MLEVLSSALQPHVACSDLYTNCRQLRHVRQVTRHLAARSVHAHPQQVKRGERSTCIVISMRVIIRQGKAPSGPFPEVMLEAWGCPEAGEVEEGAVYCVYNLSASRNPKWCAVGDGCGRGMAASWSPDGPRLIPTSNCGGSALQVAVSCLAFKTFLHFPNRTIGTLSPR